MPEVPLPGGLIVYETWPTGPNTTKTLCFQECVGESDVQFARRILDGIAEAMETCPRWPPPPPPPPQ